jgi:hypothetical protein
VRFRSILIVAACAAVAAAALSSVATARPSKACPPGTSNADYCHVAPGQFCKGMSKKHIPGQKGTPYSQCVSAMAKLSKKPSMAPSQVCAGLRKAKGKKAKKDANKAFNQCVAGGKKLKQDVAQSRKHA